MGISDNDDAFENKKTEKEKIYGSSRRQEEELPYVYNEQEPIEQVEIKQSSVGDVQRILALLGISSFDQIKKITPINSIKEVTSMRECKYINRGHSL